MKTKFLFFTLFLVSLNSNAQLLVDTGGKIYGKNQLVVLSKPNTALDGVDLVGQNSSLPSYCDLLCGWYSVSQPNNPGLLTLSSVEGAYFTVRANGHVGIFNNNPGEALEVGTTGSNYQIRVNGNLVLTSDERVKENIKDIDKSLDKLKQLKGVSYNFKGIKDSISNTNVNLNVNEKLTNSSSLSKPGFIPQNNKKNINRYYYGFLAQDVQKLFPDLVYADSAGVLGVDYIGIIPLLVNALNEQENKITELETRLAKLENNSSSTQKKVGANNNPDETNTLTYPVLEQNVPNPFNVSTSIAYYLPKTISTAAIYVYDMNGIQLKTYPISEREKGNITIKGSELIAGMYLYALIADGKIIDTKRMILTK